jgi:4-alpha-glucanotransferase
MSLARRSGILLHPTSLPGRWGIGDLGPNAYAFVDVLVAAGQQLWQVMPLGPTGYGDSPYQCFSAFAGNPLLISPDLLLRDGFLTSDQIGDLPDFPRSTVDYGWVIPWKLALLKRSFEHFEATATPEQQIAFSTFCTEQASWLADYALFAALKEAHDGASWNTWDLPIRRHEPEAVRFWSDRLVSSVRFQSYLQFLFFSQWRALRAYANHNNVQIIGDIPIFVAYDSADAWAHSDLFLFDDAGNPTHVAGVPPDYFSATGQLWGNPLYRWDVLAERGYRWWIERIRSNMQLFDLLRIDHFRGFEAYWEVPASETTAIKGRWVKGPDAALFEAIKAALGDLPIIAEDLGVITPQVEALRDRFNFPGMRVLQFAFGGDPDSLYLPHNYIPRSVVYTGTHDNDTTRGWWQTAGDGERSFTQLYLARDGHDISWDIMRAALASVAETAIIPLQDVLSLGSEARMNTPGQASGNWGWRVGEADITPAHIERLQLLTKLYGRHLPPPKATPPATGNEETAVTA